ncbi:MAG: NAD(P)H-dependent oxidoreductase [Eubacteriales bacterium]|nr:NAD(P)H-dependent oxidoreductase [Eubacteriales bacterium]
MKSRINFICPGSISPLQREMNVLALSDYDYLEINVTDNLQPIKNGKILLSIYVDSTGINIEMMRMLKKISRFGHNFFEDSSVVLFVVGDSELYTKSMARKVILYLTQAGASFIGRPLVETTGSMKNLAHVALSKNLMVRDAALELAKELINRLMQDSPPKKENPELLVLYSSNWDTSNTLMLWSKVKPLLSGVKIKEIHIENGSVRDCIGCPYKTCKHYGQQERCYYGGIMVTEVYPAVLSCDALLLLCPNYNDSISANLSAVINRLTALFRKTQFYDKYLFSIIVSGHSGSDLLAEQLISALNINKTFRLPANFAMMETANDPGDVLKLDAIDLRINQFAENIKKTLIK